MRPRGTWVYVLYPQVPVARSPGSLADAAPRSENRGMNAELTATETPDTSGARNLSTALCELAQLEFRLGDWWSAHSCARQALEMARSRGREHEAMHALARLAAIEAGRGDAGECRRHAAEATWLSRALDEPPVEALAMEALGFLELGLGRPGEAVRCLENVRGLWRTSRQARSLAAEWPLHLADAHVRLGNRAAAESALERMDKRATRIRSFVLAAACERSRGMLAADDSFETRFTRALHWNDWAKQPFELARTQLCFGERLRRAGRCRDACAQLASARETFEALGARPWAAAARCELEREAR